jgi:hypothetical protein
MSQQFQLLFYLIKICTEDAKVNDNNQYYFSVMCYMYITEVFHNYSLLFEEKVKNKQGHINPIVIRQLQYHYAMQLNTLSLYF